MAGRSKSGILIAAFVWLVILGALAVGYKCFLRPRISRKLADETGAPGRLRHEVNMALDSFSGYCVLRSDLMEKELKSRGIKLGLIDDKADYTARIKALRTKEAQFAVFTVDSYLAAGVKTGEFPGSIVMVIDETKGADGIVAYKGAVGSFEDLNVPESKIVLTPGSPSEFLARVIIANLSLPNLSSSWMEEANGAEDVYQRFRSGERSAKKAYVLWQPYISKALSEQGAHVLFDTSKLDGYIVDVLVVERGFLRDQPEIVKGVVEAYLTTAYHYLRSREEMVKLVKEDARKFGSEDITETQAGGIVEGIWWKNTLENYAHFGLLQAGQAKIPYMEDIIDNILGVLVKTGALSGNPLAGETNKLFYPKTLEALKVGNFHPGTKLDIIKTDATPTGGEEIRGDKELPALTDEQWRSMVPVGTMRVDPIQFSRGTARLSVQGLRDLSSLAKRLKSWPQYYLIVVGQTRAEGDPEANRLLAQARADAALQHLVGEGVSKNRIQTQAQTSSGSQEVSFLLGQLPY